MCSIFSTSQSNQLLYIVLLISGSHMLPKKEPLCRVDCKGSKERAVCGTDGVTYNSRCELQQALCSGFRVKFRHRGACHSEMVPGVWKKNGRLLKLVTNQEFLFLSQRAMRMEAISKSNVTKELDIAGVLQRQGSRCRGLLSEIQNHFVIFLG